MFCLCLLAGKIKKLKLYRVFQWNFSEGWGMSLGTNDIDFGGDLDHDADPGTCYLPVPCGMGI